MRSFVAINPAAEEAKRLYAAASELRGSGFPIRWIRSENIHLTLKFLGEVPEGRIHEMGDALARALADVRRFELELEGFGAFPSPRRPSVIWAGVNANSALEEVFARVEDALAQMGYPRESRDFHPHLTLGRGRRSTRPRQFRGFAEILEALSWSDTFQADAVDLMRSELRPTGAEYDAVRRVELHE